MGEKLEGKVELSRNRHLEFVGARFPISTIGEKDEKVLVLHAVSTLNEMGPLLDHLETSQTDPCQPPPPHEFPRANSSTSSISVNFVVFLSPNLSAWDRFNYFVR